MYVRTHTCALLIAVLYNHAEFANQLNRTIVQIDVAAGVICCTASSTIHNIAVSTNPGITGNNAVHTAFARAKAGHVDRTTIVMETPSIEVRPSYLSPYVDNYTRVPSNISYTTERALPWTIRLRDPKLFIFPGRDIASCHDIPAPTHPGESAVPSAASKTQEHSPGDHIAANVRASETDRNSNAATCTQPEHAHDTGYKSVLALSEVNFIITDAPGTRPGAMSSVRPRVQICTHVNIHPVAVTLHADQVRAVHTLLRAFALTQQRSQELEEGDEVCDCDVRAERVSTEFTTDTTEALRFGGNGFRPMETPTKTLSPTTRCAPREVARPPIWLQIVAPRISIATEGCVRHGVESYHGPSGSAKNTSTSADASVHSNEHHHSLQDKLTLELEHVSLAVAMQRTTASMQLEIGDLCCKHHIREVYQHADSLASNPTTAVSASNCDSVHPTTSSVPMLGPWSRGVFDGFLVKSHPTGWPSKDSNTPKHNQRCCIMLTYARCDGVNLKDSIMYYCHMSSLWI